MKNITSITKASINDLANIMLIINDAKAYLRECGSRQWNTDSYPNRDTILFDIKNSNLYTYRVNDIPVGIMALLGHDENYDSIDGMWLSNDNYLSIHRLAILREYHHTNVAKSLMDYAYNYAKANSYKSIKVDTHNLNKDMQGLLKKCGYTLCGEITLLRTIEDNLRLAFEIIIK